MAGHSQFKNIMRRKGAQDIKRGKLFTKIGREIIAACKTGSPDPASNPRLRTAVLWAREENMPRDRIEAAIKRASGNNDSDNFDSVRYEGYGAGGIAVIVNALTDNRNRTASDIRSAFTKCGGNMGESGSVSFMFHNIGLIVYAADKASEEAMLEAAIDAGAEDCALVGDEHHITTAIDTLGLVRDRLEATFGEAKSARLVWQPANLNSVNDEHAAAIIKLIDMLEDLDDVQEVICNADFTAAQMGQADA
jgi:YebC/PmpR family DNA-binding regulatory protein